jgi:Arc/MetJ family transcription regulator
VYGSVYADVYWQKERMFVMRTNIVIDNELMQRAIALSQLKTKKDVVHAALEEFVTSRERRNLAELRGKIQFASGYDYKSMRKGRFV